MGYYIRTPQTSFAIANKNLPRFFELVSKLMSDENVGAFGNGGSYGNGGKTRSWYSWVNTDEVRKAVVEGDIYAVFAAWGYDLELTNNVDDTSYYFLDIRGGDAKIGDEEKLFAAIAPVVEDGSFLDVVGEDGEQWRWSWQNGKFYSQDVIEKKFVFAEPAEIEFNTDANDENEEETV